MQVLVAKPEQLADAAKSLLDDVPDGRVFAFAGEMGAGKTSLIKALCAVLGIGEAVSSPTYALVNEYRSGMDEPVYHFDFYRIDSDEEAMDIGLEEYLDSGAYCFIEWPEKVEKLLPSTCIEVDIEVLEDGTRRLSW